MKKVRIGFIVLFIGILFVFFFKTIFSHETISMVEKRELTTFPKFQVSKLVDSEYYDTLTKAFNDQLFFRNHLVKGYYLMQFQRYLGDVVEGKDGEMFSAVQNSVNRNNYRNNLIEVSKDINEVSQSFSKSDTKFIFLSIPRKDAYLEEYLPSTYTSSRDIYEYGLSILKENTSDVIFIDGLEVFDNHKGDNHYYFKTDHHINPRGGELLYLEIMDIISKDYDVPIYYLDEFYDVHEATVNGSFNKQVGQSVPLYKEELWLSLKNPFSYTRYENDKESHLKIWGSGTSYETAYMEGDMAYTRVETNRSNLPNVMYVGSSFTNVLEALTVPSVNRMISIDYRHNKSGKSILDYVQEYDIDYVIFVPSQSDNALSVNNIRLHLGK